MYYLIRAAQYIHDNVNPPYRVREEEPLKLLRRKKYLAQISIKENYMQTLSHHFLPRTPFSFFP